MTSLNVKGSRWPAERLVVRRTPLATARILPTSREYNVTMRSASPRSMRLRMTAGVRYRRCLVTAHAPDSARQHTRQRLDEHSAHARVDVFDDVFDRRHQNLAACAAHEVHVVGARFD